MKFPIRIAQTLIATLLIAIVVTQAKATSYIFTKIAEAKGKTSGQIQEFAGNPSINNSGTVAFVARIPNPIEAIFTGSGGALTTIAVATAFR